MTTFSFGRKCPTCGQTSYHRIQRTWWMRFLPASKLYHCIFCYTKFVSFRTLADDPTIEKPESNRLNATSSSTYLN